MWRLSLAHSRRRLLLTVQLLTVQTRQTRRWRATAATAHRRYSLQHPPSPRATSPADVVRLRTAIRQLRPTSRQSVTSVPSRAGSGQSRASSRQSRQSVRSLVADPVVDLMNSVFDAQRADADRRELQRQAKMEAEMVRREQEAADKARLQMRVQQLETAARMQTECTTPPAVQLDSPPPVTCSVMQLGGGHAAMPTASVYAGVHAQCSMTAAPACAPAPADSADMQQLLTSRSGPGDAHAPMLEETAASGYAYAYPTVPAQADSALARTPLALADLNSQSLVYHQRLLVPLYCRLRLQCTLPVLVYQLW